MTIRILKQTDTTFQHEKIQFLLTGYCFDFGPRGAKHNPQQTRARGHLGGPRAEVRQADAVFKTIRTHSTINLEWIAMAAIMLRVHPHFDDEDYHVANRNCMTYTRMAASTAEDAIRSYTNGGGVGRDVDNLSYDLMANSQSVLERHFSSMPNGGGY